jgi:hypothetical protein
MNWWWWIIGWLTGFLNASAVALLIWHHHVTQRWEQQYAEATQSVGHTTAQVDLK